MPNNNYQTATSNFENSLGALQWNMYHPQEFMRLNGLNSWSQNLEDGIESDCESSSDSSVTVAYDLDQGSEYWMDNFNEVIDELDYSSACNSIGYSSQPVSMNGVSGYEYLNDSAVHFSNFQDVLNDVENFDKSSLFDVKRFNERGALHNERSALVLELKGFEQLTSQLESSYTSKKAVAYNKTNVLTSFFSDPKPAQSRLDSITKIQDVVKLVQDDLSILKVQPSLFNAEDQMMAMKYQVHHLQQAILAIKGAALNEFSKVSDSYKVLPASRSAMHAVLQSTYNCQQMSAQDKVDSKSAFNKFESKLELSERMEAEAAKVQPQALVV